MLSIISRSPCWFLADVCAYLRWNFRPVTVDGVVGKAGPSEKLLKDSDDTLGKGCPVKEGYVVEPQFVAVSWMAMKSHSIGYSAERPVAVPVRLYAVVSAVEVHGFAVRGAEYLVPRQANLWMVVSDVPPAAPAELLDDVDVKRGGDLTHVGQWRCPT
jgi:hypothetical protein